MRGMRKLRNVGEYISNAPKEHRAKLRELRSAIRKTAPAASEKLSYGMPYYGYKGRLVYFAIAKKHIGIYIPTPIVQEFKKELKEYEAAKATIRFPLDKKLPLGLIKKLIKARMKLNESAKKK